MAGGRFGTSLEYVVPKSMERVASAAEVEYVLRNSVGGVAESKNFPTVDLALQETKDS